MFQHWQKRDCEVKKDKNLYISTGDDIRPPTKITILISDIRKCPDEELTINIQTPQKIHILKASNKEDFDKWFNVLLNAKKAALDEQFDKDNIPCPSPTNEKKELDSIIKHIRNFPGNEKCCDCGSEEDVTWLSTNLGILLCIQCSGFHRGKR